MRRLSLDVITNASIVALALAIGIGSVMLFASRPEPATIRIIPPPATRTPAPTATPPPIQVYVTGAVQNPQTVVELPYGSRVADAIAAAGGFAEAADQASLNLAAVLGDGDQVHAFDLSGESQTLATPSGGFKLGINSASVEQLQNLPGVGPALAQRIFDFREQIGRFRGLADLDWVAGIGEATLDKWRGLIEFD